MKYKKCKNKLCNRLIPITKIKSFFCGACQYARMTGYNLHKEKIKKYKNKCYLCNKKSIGILCRKCFIRVDKKILLDRKKERIKIKIQR